MFEKRLVLVFVFSLLFLPVVFGTTVHTYNFSSLSDRVALEYSSSSDTTIQPFDAGTNFTDYSGITDSDNSYYTTLQQGSMSDNMAIQHNFNVKINEDVNDIVEINITWEGYYELGGEDTSHSYDIVEVETDTGTETIGDMTATDTSFTLHITSNFENYLNNSNYINVRAFVNATPSGVAPSLKLHTDFFEIKVVTESSNDDPAWWNSSWSYKRAINITENSGSSLTDYQVKISLNTTALYEAGKIQVDCDDIRFVNSLENTELTYCVEKCITNDNSTNSTFWVKVPSINANDNEIIYVYYGNPTADTTSDCENTFIFFDDAETDTSKWAENSASYGDFTRDSTIKKYGSYSFKFDDTSPTYAYRVYNYSSSSRSSVTVRFFMRVEDATNENTFYTIDGGLTDWTTNSVLMSIYNEYLQYYDGSWHQVKAISDNTWYEIELAMNFNNYTYDIYVDGNKEVDDASFRNNVGTWKYWVFTTKDSQETNYYFDNFIIREFATSEPTYTLGSEENQVSPKYTISINNPSNNSNQTKDIVFTLNATIQCIDASCGDTNVYLQTNSTSMNWANTSLSKRYYINITENSGSTLTDYQVEINISYDSDMQTDFDDIRFYDSDNTTKLTYYIKEKSDGNWAYVIVKIPNIPASSTKKIWLYYGNSTATSESSTDAFEYYEDFSSSHIYDFVKSDSNPVLTGYEQPSIIKNGTTYWMYADDGANIYRFTSTDGISWGSGTLVLSGGIYADVWKDGSTYRMVYTTTDMSSIKLATSTDGLSFTDQGILLNKSSSGWDSYGIYDPTEIKVGSTYYLYYAGRNVTSGTTFSAIGMANSSDGSVGSYTKQGMVLEPTTGWEDISLFDPSIIEYDTNKYILFYTAWDGTLQRWGFATNNTNMSSWIKHSNNPIVWNTQSWEGVNSIEPDCLIEDNKYKCWYHGDSTDKEIGYLYFNQNQTTKLPITDKKWKKLAGTWSVTSGYLRGYDSTYYGLEKQNWSLSNFSANLKYYAETDYDNAGSILSFRATDTENLYLLESMTNGTAYFPKLWKRVSGSYTALNTSTTSFSADTWVDVTIKAYGNNILVYLNNNLVINATDSTFDSGKTYIGANGVDYKRWDNISISKYVSPEPSTSTGSEESYSQLTDVSSTTVINTSSSNPYSCGVMNQNDYCYPEWNLTGREIGNYTLKVIANSSVTSNNSAIYVNIITHPPTVNLVSPPNNNVTSDRTPTFTFNFTDSDSSTASCELLINGTGYGKNTSVSNNTNTNITANTTLTPNQLYSWNINCSDGTNSSLGSARNITIENNLPEITLNSPEDDSEIDTIWVLMNATLSDADGDLMTVSFKLYSDTGTYLSGCTYDDSPDGTYTCNISGLSIGETYYWNVTANDSYNTTISDTRSFSVSSEKQQTYDIMTSGVLCKYGKSTSGDAPPPDNTYNYTLNSEQSCVQGNVNASDDVKQQSSGSSGYYAMFKLYFDLNQDPSLIDNLKIYIEGNANSDTYPMKLYVWNMSSSSYSYLDEINSTEITYTKIFTNASEIVNDTDDLVIFLIEATYDSDSGSGIIYLDYFKLEVNYQNSPPQTTTPTIIPSTAYTDSTLNASSTYTDNDGDLGNVTCRWWKNSVNIYNETKTSISNNSVVWFTLSSGNFTKGDNITCEMRAYDGTDYESWENSSIKTISNTKPTITTTQTTVNIDAGSTYSYDYNASDLDVDDGVDTLTWSDNTTLFDINPTTGEITDTPSESEAGTYQINITVSDGTDTDWDTFTYTINDVTPPSVSWSSPTPNKTDITTGNSVTINITASDGKALDTCVLEWDGTNETFDNNDGTNWWETKSTIDGHNYTINVYCNDTSGNVGSAGERWFIENSKATTVSYDMTGSAKTNDNIYCWFNATDNQNTTLTYYVKWYNSSTSYQTNSSTFTNATLVNVSLGANIIRKNEQWTCEITIYDGYENNTAVNTSTLTVSDSPPTTPDISEVSPSTAYTTSNLTWTVENSTDVDGDSITYECQVKDTDNSTILMSWKEQQWFDCNTTGCDKGDTIHIECHAVTSDANSSSAYQTKTISNSAPSVSLNSPSDGATGQGTTVTLNVTVTDADGDSMDVTFYDASDNSAICTNTSISDGSYVTCLWSGLNYDTTYQWYVNATDGTDTTQSSTWSFSTSTNNAPVLTSDSVTPSSPTTWDTPPQTYNFTINATDDTGLDTVTLEFDGTNYTVTTHNGDIYYKVLYNLSANPSGYTYRWYANDTSGQQSNTSNTYIINKKNPSGSITSHTNPTYPDKVSIEATVSEGDSGQPFYLYNNDTGSWVQIGSSTVGNTIWENETYSAGTHWFNLTYPATENYSYASSTTYAIVSKGTGYINLLINGTDGDKTLKKNTTANFTVQLIDQNGNYLNFDVELWTDLDGSMSLWDSGSANLTNITVLNYPTGDYIIKGNWSGNENYTAVSENHTLTISSNIISSCTDITSSGSYTLSTDITDATGGADYVCIKITSSDVVLDCNNHIIDGTDNSLATGIQITSATGISNITIKNCKLKEWGSAGIRVNDAVTDVNITGVTVYNSTQGGYGIYFLGVNSSSIENSVVENITGAGASAIYVSSSNSEGDITIKNNEIENIAGDCIYFYNTTGVIQSNTITNCSGSGSDAISFSYSSANITNNNITNAGRYGMYSSSDSEWGSSDNSNITGNIINNTDDTGIYIYLSNSITIKNNIVGNITSNGIHILSVNNSEIDQNTIETISSGYEGIYIYESDSNTISNNTVEDAGDGISLFSSSSNTIVNNTIKGNIVGYAISLTTDSTSNTIYNNIFNATDQVSVGTGSNYWNTTKTSGTNILGDSYLGGNVYTNPSGTGFSDTCSDIDGDRICDESKTLSTDNIDYLPLAIETPLDFYVNDTELTSIEFSMNQTDSKTFNITTVNNENYYYNVTYGTEGDLSNNTLFIVTFDSTSHNLTASETFTQEITITGNDTPAGDYTGNITVTRTDTGSVSRISVTMHISTSVAHIDISPDSVSISAYDNEVKTQTYNISNDGNRELQYVNCSIGSSLISYSSWNETNFNVSAGSWRLVKLTLSNVNEGTYSETVTCIGVATDNGGTNSDTSSLTFVSTAHPTGGGGGGGSSTPVPTKSRSIEFTNEYGGETLSLVMDVGDVRTKNLRIKNTGEETETINFYCEKISGYDLCNNVALSKTYTTLEQGQEEIISLTVEINEKLEEEAQFSIVAESTDKKLKEVVLVKVTTSSLGALLDIANKIPQPYVFRDVMNEDAEDISIPFGYTIISSLCGLLVFIILNSIVKKRKWIPILAFIITFLIVISIL